MSSHLFFYKLIWACPYISSFVIFCKFCPSVMLSFQNLLKSILWFSCLVHTKVFQKENPLPQSHFCKVYKVKDENMKKLDCASFPIVCGPMFLWSGPPGATNKFLPMDQRHTIPYFSKVTKRLSPLVNLKTVFSAKRHIETT